MWSRWLCIVVAALASVVHAQEAEERFDFKGVKLGTPLQAVRATLRLTCAPDKTGEFDTACVYRDKADRTYAGVPAQEIMFGFFGDKLDSVSVLTKGTYYDEIKAALDGKFGQVTPSPGLNGLSTYMRNGDRIHLMWFDGQTFVRYEAAAGAEERARREALRKAKRDKGI